jgi:two-component system, NarL family, nitrate/nitrite response regulator NarL
VVTSVSVNTVCDFSLEISFAGHTPDRVDWAGNDRYGPASKAYKSIVMTNSFIKILLIGDYSIFRSALRMLIETDRRIRVVGEANKLDGALEIMSEETPDLLLVDLSDLDGKDFFPLLNSVTIPILILVGQHDSEIYQKCLRMGVKGLILKEESSDNLFKAIEKIHEGEIWFDRTMMGETIRQLINERQMLHDNPKAHITNSLTDREMQVVDLICKGMKNKPIADELFITETTVRHHLTSVFNKLEITSRLELVIYAFKNNLVKLPSNGLGVTNNGHAKISASSTI